MLITIKCDNRPLVAASEWAYLENNYASGVSSMVVTNTSFFSADDYVIIGEIGNEATELLKIATVTPATQTVTFSTPSVFAHSESSRITFIPYNQVRFYHTDTSTFNTATPISGQRPISPSFWYTQFDDSTYTTGYGWFVVSNDITLESVTSTSPIPYANFARNTVKKAMDGCNSLLGDEARLVTPDELLEWLCEAYDKSKNALDLNVDEYDASEQISIDVVAGTTEYDLEPDFGEMLSVTTSQFPGSYLYPIDINRIDQYYVDGYSLTNGYYIRGNKIGFLISPVTPFTAYYRYKKMAPDLVNYYDTIDLPKKAFNCLKDFMMYRAFQKLRNPSADKYLQAFNTELADMRQQANNRDNSLDSMKPRRWTNV